MTAHEGKNEGSPVNGLQAPVEKELEEIHSKIINVYNEDDLNDIRFYTRQIAIAIKNNDYEVLRPEDYDQDIKKILSEIKESATSVVTEPVVLKSPRSNTTLTITYLSYAYHQSATLRLKHYLMYTHVYPAGNMVEVRLNLLRG